VVFHWGHALIVPEDTGQGLCKDIDWQAGTSFEYYEVRERTEGRAAVQGDSRLTRSDGGDLTSYMAR
jgi:hypothetical protein